MDYKEEYERALSTAKMQYRNTAMPDNVKEILSKIFPELKESEDERTRKEIIEALNSLASMHYPLTSIERHNEWIAWLEKQETSYTRKDVDDAYLKGISDTKNEIERQYEANYQIRKDIATFIFNYRGDIKDRAKWMNYLGIKVSFTEVEQGGMSNKNDERLRKTTICFLKDFAKQGYENAVECIDWLEKQVPVDVKEEAKKCIELSPDEGGVLVNMSQFDRIAKPGKVDNANKVETKFNIGDWIVTTGRVSYKVIDIREYRYEVCYMLIDTDNKEYESGIQSIERDCRLWTIQDAEDGDVLVASDGSIFVFAGTDDCYCKHYVALATNGVIVVNKGLKQNWEDSCGVHPATKEERELLFSKMGERDYQWDANNKRIIYLL